MFRWGKRLKRRRKTRPYLAQSVSNIVSRKGHEDCSTFTRSPIRNWSSMVWVTGSIGSIIQSGRMIGAELCIASLEKRISSGKTTLFRMLLNDFAIPEIWKK